MIGFNHALAGVIIAATVPAPLVPVVALASHFLMDALPHFGNSVIFKPYTKAFKRLLLVDAVLCTTILAFSFWLFPDKWWLMIIGTFFATLPDFLWLLEGRVKWLQRYFAFAKKIQWSETPEGWTYELIYLSLLFLTLSIVA
ncbi:hypothetical protein GX865_01350 [Candidatus Saccharibacteria bacterium]|jgi:hypothetical protein|nr:hypothetical protein [Candidatus Saccharibacteria bacterium]